MNRFLLLGILLFTSIHSTQAQTEAKAWEAHFNVRSINSFLDGEGSSFLVKRRLSNQTYARLGLQGYMVSKKQTGTLGNHVLTKSLLIQTRLGLEKRTAINDRFFFLRGADLIYEYSGTDIRPPVSTQYTEKQRIQTIGLSPFVGIHYKINSAFGILAETHMDASVQFLRNRVNNDTGSTYPNRIETRTDVLIDFQPFQYLTFCFTF